MIQFYDHLNILIKPTEGCNLRCVYCFNKNYGYVDELMSMETLEKLYSIMFPYYKSISIVWHGGEPTFAGIDFYKKAFKLQDTFVKKYGVTVKNSMQTNATLLTDEFVEFIKSRNISLGISYDGPANDLTRKSTQMVLSTIERLKQHSIRPGIITVVSKKNIADLIATYEHLKKIGLGGQLNHYIEMDKNSPCHELTISTDQYIAQMYELFLYWLNDTNCNIDLNPFRTYIEQYLFEVAPVCIHASCMRSWMCMNHSGDLSACDKVFPVEYQYGNIMNYSDIREVYNSDGFRNLMLASITRRNKCIKTCEFYKYCEGGCNHSAMVEGEIENNGGFSCVTFKALFGKICAHLKSLNLQVNNIEKVIPNTYLQKALLARVQNR